MSAELGLLTTLAGFLLAGLAGSLHCVGMCGPILAGLVQVMPASSVTVEGRRSAAGRTAEMRRRAALTTWYHVGRLSTYVLLGAVSGLVGGAVQDRAVPATWTRWTGLAAAGLALLAAVVVVAWPRIASGGCGGGRRNGEPGEDTCATSPPPSATTSAGRAGALLVRFGRSLAATPRTEARLLLGALMGWLPCGLVYATLALAAALGHPVLSGLAMLAFGLGTIPALTASTLVVDLVPAHWRRHGPRLAAVSLALVAGVMAWRSWPTEAAASDPGACPLCATESDG